MITRISGKVWSSYRKRLDRQRMMKYAPHRPAECTSTKHASEYYHDNIQNVVCGEKLRAAHKYVSRARSFFSKLVFTHRLNHNSLTPSSLNAEQKKGVCGRYLHCGLLRLYRIDRGSFSNILRRALSIL